MRKERRKNLSNPGDDGVWRAADVFADPAFPLGLVYAEPQPPDPPHTHSGFSELVVVFAGKGTHTLERERYGLGRGDAFVITGNQVHGYEDVDGLCLVNCMFDPDQTLKRVPHITKLPGYHALFHLEPRYRRQHNFESRLRLSPDELGHVLSLLDDLVLETESRGPGYEFMASALLMELVGFLCRCYRGNPHPASHGLIVMDQVIAHLESNYAQPLDLDDLTKLAGLPKRTFMRAFKEATSLSPIDYLIRLRVAHAAELLQATDQSITDIALGVGFWDSNYFARQFKRVMGMSPSTYRDRRRSFEAATGQEIAAPVRETSATGP